MFFILFLCAVPSRPGHSPVAAPLGPLGQPIRRINTFTASLPSFEEGDDGKGGGHHHHHLQNNTDAEADHFVSQMLGESMMSPTSGGGDGNLASTLDDAMRMLGEST